MINREPRPFCTDRGTVAAQEYIQDLIRADPAEVDKIVRKPENCDFSIWMYEQIKQFVIEIGILALTIKDECSYKNCPIMKVGNDCFKCTVHSPWKECSAYEYTIHNLDHFNELLIEYRSLLRDGNLSQTELEPLFQMVRRLYRIFAHSITIHKNIFIEFEEEMYLYRRFWAFVRIFEIEIKDDLFPPTSLGLID